MKHIMKLLGTQSRRLCAVALVAVIAFSFTSCGTTSSRDDGAGGEPTKFEGRWHNEYSGIPDFSYTFTGNNFSFNENNGQGNFGYSGTFTFTDTTITFVVTEGQSVIGGNTGWTQGYTLSAAVLTLVDDPQAPSYGPFTAVLALSSSENGATGGGNGNMDEIIRVDKEVRDLLFYDTTGDGQIDLPGDSGTVGGLCSDYAVEFYYRYPGEVYLVARDSGGNLKWATAEMLPANTYTWRTRGENFGVNSNFSSLIGGSGEYDGVLRDARTITVSTEAWTEWSHATVNNHMWCAAVADGKWYLVDPTWRDPNPNNSPIKEILPPVNIVRRQ